MSGPACPACLALHLALAFFDGGSAALLQNGPCCLRLAQHRPATALPPPFGALYAPAWPRNSCGGEDN